MATWGLSATEEYKIKIVENGFVVTSDEEKQYIFSTLKEVFKFLEKEMK